MEHRSQACRFRQSPNEPLKRRKAAKLHKYELFITTIARQYRLHLFQVVHNPGHLSLCKLTCCHAECRLYLFTIETSRVQRSFNCSETGIGLIITVLVE